MLIQFLFIFFLLIRFYKTLLYTIILPTKIIKKSVVNVNSPPENSHQKCVLKLGYIINPKTKNKGALHLIC
jgi:hypothetical protein